MSTPKFQIAIKAVSYADIPKRHQFARGPRRPQEILEVTCWCERLTVPVHRDEVRRGRTISCGDEECHPGMPNRARRIKADLARTRDLPGPSEQR